VGARKLLDALWDFLAVHAWPVYRRWRAAGAWAPFASVRAYHKRWFRDAHYDEYDRWAHFKWKKSREEGARVEAQQALPDLYTLMKRRHKLVVEADECREEAHAFAVFASTRMREGGETYAEWRANGDYVQTYETDGARQNVHRPASGGRSYGAGAYTTLEHDPYCTFGRQRGALVIKRGHNEPKYRTPAEEPRTVWPTARTKDDCNFCAGDESSLPTFPEPRKPPDDPSKRSVSTLSVTKSKKAKKLRGLPFLATASRRVLQLCRTRFRAQMTEALLGHRRRTAEAPAI
jgi:hypothetical protein